ncbi:MAG: UvrB/UvrC motif-containing protein [Patescibacteria group bacterium]
MTQEASEQTCVSVHYRSCRPLGRPAAFYILDLAARNDPGLMFGLPVGEASLPLVQKVFDSPRPDKTELARLLLNIFGCKVYRVAKVIIGGQKRNSEPAAHFGWIVALPVNKHKRQKGHRIERMVSALDAVVVGYLAKVDILVERRLMQPRSVHSKPVSPLDLSQPPLSGFRSGAKAVLTFRFSPLADQKGLPFQYPPLSQRQLIFTVGRQLEQAIRQERFGRAANLRDRLRWLWGKFHFEFPQSLN